MGDAYDINKPGWMVNIKFYLPKEVVVMGGPRFIQASECFPHQVTWSRWLSEKPWIRGLNLNDYCVEALHHRDNPVRSEMNQYVADILHCYQKHSFVRPYVVYILNKKTPMGPSVVFAPPCFRQAVANFPQPQATSRVPMQIIHEQNLMRLPAPLELHQRVAPGFFNAPSHPIVRPVPIRGMVLNAVFQQQQQGLPSRLRELLAAPIRREGLRSGERVLSPQQQQPWRFGNNFNGGGVVAFGQQQQQQRLPQHQQQNLGIGRRLPMEVDENFDQQALYNGRLHLANVGGGSPDPEAVDLRVPGRCTPDYQRDWHTLSRYNF